MHSGLVSRRDAAATCDRAARHGMAWHGTATVAGAGAGTASLTKATNACCCCLRTAGRQTGPAGSAPHRCSPGRLLFSLRALHGSGGPPRPPPRRHRHHRSFLRRIVPASPGESLAVGRAAQPCAVKVIQVKVTLDVTARDDVLSVSCRSMAATARH